MVQVAGTYAPRPTFPVGPTYCDASDIVEFRPRDTHFVLYDYLHDTPVGFMEYAWREIHKRYVRPLLSAHPQDLEGRFAAAGTGFVSAFTAIKGAIAVALEDVTERERAIIMKATGDSLHRLMVEQAADRLGELAAHSMLSSIKTIRLVERAVHDANREGLLFDEKPIEGASLAWALAFSAVALYVTEDKPRGKSNAITLAGWARDFSNEAYVAARKQGALLKVRGLTHSVTYVASDDLDEEDEQLTEAAHCDGGIRYLRQEEESE